MCKDPQQRDEQKALLDRLHLVPNPHHPEACARLKAEIIEGHPRVSLWMREFPRYRRGQALMTVPHLPAYGAPCDVVSALEAMDAEASLVEFERLERAKKTPTAGPKKFHKDSDVTTRPQTPAPIHYKIKGG